MRICGYTYSSVLAQLSNVSRVDPGGILYSIARRLDRLRTTLTAEFR